MVNVERDGGNYEVELTIGNAAPPRSDLPCPDSAPGGMSSRVETTPRPTCLHFVLEVPPGLESGRLQRLGLQCVVPSGGTRHIDQLCMLLAKAYILNAKDVLAY